MSQVRRNDLRPDSDVTLTDDNQFKKSFQTVGKPPVTERDMHEDFMRDPPNVRSRSSSMEHSFNVDNTEQAVRA